MIIWWSMPGHSVRTNTCTQVITPVQVAVYGLIMVCQTVTSTIGRSNCHHFLLIILFFVQTYIILTDRCILAVKDTTDLWREQHGVTTCALLGMVWHAATIRIKYTPMPTGSNPTELSVHWKRTIRRYCWQCWVAYRPIMYWTSWPTAPTLKWPSTVLLPGVPGERANRHHCVQFMVTHHIYIDFTHVVLQYSMRWISVLWRPIGYWLIDTDWVQATHTDVDNDRPGFLWWLTN